MSYGHFVSLEFRFMLCSCYTTASPNHIVFAYEDPMILSVSYFQVKLTIMIEDAREVERRRLLGIEDLDGPTREDLVDALDEVSFFFNNRD